LLNFSRFSLDQFFIQNRKSMTLQLTVPNMACSACANNITNAVKTVDASADVQADPTTKLVNVDTQASEAAIKDALAAAGYPAA
jgi:copper chaperone